MKPGDRVRIYIPKGSALGALHDEEGASRHRVVTIVDPSHNKQTPLVDLTWAGHHQIPLVWIKG